MVHAEMMTKITFRTVAEKRAYKPGDISMYPLKILFEKFPVANAMKHKPKPTFVIKLRDVEIWDSDCPPNPAFEKRRKKQYPCNDHNQMNPGKQVYKSKITFVIDDL